MSCEHYEMEISALIDGELPAAEALTVTDHLLHCPDCQEFYCLVRGVDHALEEAKLIARTGDLPVGLWTRIDAASGAQSRSNASQDKVVAMRKPHQVAPWLLKMAAAVLIMVGVWSLGQLWVNPGLGGGALQVHLESDRGAMNDERFIDITTELLRADRRYHQKMLEIMTAINSHSYVSEGSPESDVPTVRTGTGEVGVAQVDTETPESVLEETW